MNKFVYFIGFTLLLTIAAMGFYIWQNEQDKALLKEELNNQSVVVPFQAPTNDSKFEQPSETSSPSAGIDQSGTITGSVSFPSEVIPDMEVCAENVNSDQEICTTEILEEVSYTFGKGYRLDVPAGTYTVYAKLPNDSYKAYYNEFVTCGLMASCTSHEPIPVEVEVGDIITGIDPQDWYNQ